MSETSDRPIPSTPYRMLQFDLKSLFGMILGFAILLAVHDLFNWASLVTLGLMIVGLGLLESHSRIVMAALIFAMLIPYGWLLVIDYPWDSYRRTWVSIWPTLPGLLPARLVFDEFSDRTLFFISGAITLVFLAIGIVAGRYNRTLFWLTLAFVGAASIVSSLITYQLFWF